jgi:hypothetical protein
MTRKALIIFAICVASALVPLVALMELVAEKGNR